MTASVECSTTIATRRLEGAVRAVAGRQGGGAGRAAPAARRRRSGARARSTSTCRSPHAAWSHRPLRPRRPRGGPRPPGRRADARPRRRRRRHRRHPGRVRRGSSATASLHRWRARRGWSTRRRPRARPGAGAPAAAIRRDVTDREQVEATVDRVVGGVRLDRYPDQQRRHARPRCAVLEAVAGAVGARPRVNLTGAFNCAQAVWPHMVERVLGPNREHGLGGRHARRLRPGELLDDEGRPARPHARTLAMEGGRHGITQRHRPGRDRDRGLQLRQPRDEPVDRQPDRVQAPRASRRTSPTRSRSLPDLAAYVTGIELNVSGGVELFVFPPRKYM